MDKNIKILCIGNSFSEDTTSYVAEIAKSFDFKDVVIANLYIGGCPISKHYENLINDLPVYRYDRNLGFGWSQTPDYKISDAIRGEEWDWISIQHGSSYGASYIKDECYDLLPMLVKEIKNLATNKTKIAFNMTWVGEPDFDHHDMITFDRDQKRCFNAICNITERIVSNIKDIDCICPTGTAIQNARTTRLNNYLSRDGYHLSMGIGRFIAGLAFLCKLAEICVDNVSWQPQGVNEEDKKIVIKSVNMAIENPFCISEITE